MTFNKSIKVKLTSEEIELAEELAQNRFPIKRAAGVKNRRVDQKRSDHAVELMGGKGEVAFSRLSGLPVDKSKTLTGDGGVDFICKGIKIGVKTPFVGAEYLLIPMHQCPPVCDVYVMQREVSPLSIEVVGFCTRDEFMDNCVVKTFGYKYEPTNSLHMRELHPINHLFDILEINPV